MQIFNCHFLGWQTDGYENSGSLYWDWLTFKVISDHAVLAVQELDATRRYMQISPEKYYLTGFFLTWLIFGFWWLIFVENFIMHLFLNKPNLQLLLFLVICKKWKFLVLKKSLFFIFSCDTPVKYQYSGTPL